MNKLTWVDSSRITVVVGHFGSGKTEFSVNLALALGKAGHPFALADLDFVDPYFCSRECKELLEAHGGKVIARSAACFDADVPALPPEVMTLIEDRSLYGVMDIGGDADGARVLARYHKQLFREAARVLCVINGNRPLTDTSEKAEKYIHSIEMASGLHIDGLINNTHFCEQTDMQDIIKGARICEELSGKLGIDFVCHVVPENLALYAAKHLSPVFPITLFMKKPWEQIAS